MSYEYWKKALIVGDGRQLTRDEAKQLGITHEPKAGFYRKREKGGPDTPVAIWSAGGEMKAVAGGRPVDAEEIWTWCATWPIAEDTYRGVAERGEPWPDDLPVAPGHNQPPTGDPHEDLLREFEGEKEMAEEFLKNSVKTQDEADRAAIWAKRLTAIANSAAAFHKAEKQPHLDAGRAVDDKWRDLKEEPKELATSLKRSLDDFLKAQARAEEERRRKAEAEAEEKRRAAALAAAKAAEEAAKASEVESAKPDPEAEKAAQAAAEAAERAAEEAAAAEAEAKEKTVTAGRTGAKASLRTFVSARIVDYDKAVVALKEHPEMRKLVEQLANRAVKAGVAVDGVERVEEKRAV